MDYILELDQVSKRFPKDGFVLDRAMLEMTGRIYGTGNVIVDENAKLNISGNIIPRAWYRTILRESGKPNLTVIIILADIVYWYKPMDHAVDERTCRSRLGGTLKGIRENLDYIQEMGFTCLYLNPVFSGREYHKYDVLDYYHIDPCLGTEVDFLFWIPSWKGKGWGGWKSADMWFCIFLHGSGVIRGDGN